VNAVHRSSLVALIVDALCQGDETLSLKYLGVCPYTTPCIRQHSLYVMHWRTGSQCSAMNVAVTWSRGLVVAGPRRNDQQHEGHVASAQVWSLAVQRTDCYSSQDVLR